jgi:hypothetical protein
MTWKNYLSSKFFNFLIYKNRNYDNTYFIELLLELSELIHRTMTGTKKTSINVTYNYCLR